MKKKKMIEINNSEELFIYKIKKTLRRFKMKKILVLALMLMVGCFLYVAADDITTHDGTIMSGTVPFVASWSLSEDDSSPFADNVDIAAFEADAFLELDLIQITDFDCNSKFKITATKGTWTLPENYHATDGAKKADGSDSDLLLMVGNVTAGYTPDGLAPLGDYGGYTIITTVGSDIIGGGAVGAGAGHGVEGAVCDINAKVLMDWPTDIVGAYSIDVTLTITEVTS